MLKSHAGYEANRARVPPALSQFTVPPLRRIHQAFDGDRVAALVRGEIAHRNVEAWLGERDNPEDALHDPAQRTSIMRPCNALSIAESCGLPRETVRRKVVQLIESGHVNRSDDGMLFLAQTVGESDEASSRCRCVAAFCVDLRGRRCERDLTGSQGRR